MPKIQNKENNENIGSISSDINKKTSTNSNKLVNTEFLKVRLKKPNSNTSLINNQSLNNLKTIKKTPNNIINNKNKNDLIKSSIDGKEISLITKYRPIKKKEISPENVSSSSSSSDSAIVVKTEAQIPARRLSNGSDKSFKTTDETSTAIEEHLREKNSAIEDEKMDTSNDKNEEMNKKTDMNLKNDKNKKNSKDSTNTNSSDEERLVIDDEKIKNSDSNESEKDINGNKQESQSN